MRLLESPYEELGHHFFRHAQYFGVRLFHVNKSSHGEVVLQKKGKIFICASNGKTFFDSLQQEFLRGNSI